MAENCSRAFENFSRHGDPFPGRWLFDMIQPLQLFLNISIFVTLILILYWLLKGSRKPVESPLDMLKKRYVSGEIDTETYVHMKKTISD
ncbi:MAG: hypothetical protein NTU61_05350 [Candidatus Altiarchaeota archaeon]|nr:hypothetical protein [Candidatus Altiarchaeota archaeon]